MPRTRQLANRTTSKKHGLISSLFAKRGLNYQDYRKGNSSLDHAVAKGLFLDFADNGLQIPSDQFIQGTDSQESPDLIPLFTNQLAVLVENRPDSDLQEAYHRKGHQLLIADSGKRTHVLITNLVDWEIFNITGSEAKYSANLTDRGFLSEKTIQRVPAIKAFKEEFVSAKSKRRQKIGGTFREALKILRYGKFPELNGNPLSKTENCLTCFHLGPNDVLAIFKNLTLFKKEETSYRDKLRGALGEGAYLTFAVVDQDQWLISSPYLENEFKGNHQNHAVLKEAFHVVGEAVLSCRKELIRKKIGSLVDTWNANFKTHYEDDEAQTRKNFLDDLLQVMGYRFRADGSNREEVYLESNGAADGRPDYAVKVDGRVLFFFEAKKPTVKCTDWATCSQAVRYSWSRGNVPVAILSNFREFRVLLAKTNPTEDNYNQLVIPELNFTSDNKASLLDKKEYQKLADYLVYLSRESVALGRFDEWLRDIGMTIEKSVPVTTRFLDTVNAFRLKLAKDLPKRFQNEQLVNSAINQLLNRILFVRVAEDRRVLDDRQLYLRLQMWNSRGRRRISLHQELIQFFREIESHFNAGLFETDDLIESVPFSNESLSHVIENLYQPKTEYHFAVLRPEIIGVAYEQALAQKIVFTPSGNPKLTEKDELQSENGIYYTPEFVVDYIVRHTIRPALEANGLHDEFRIADIACGSGAFVVAAYRELLRFEKETLEKDINKAVGSGLLALLKRGMVEQYSVSIPRRKELLVNHIFGIDVDKDACEKTKLGLFLVMMEDVLDFEKRRRALPSLESNILAGNSIFEHDYEGDMNSLYCQDPLDIFNRNEGFGSLGPAAEQNGIFDVIIGNPPYINIEKLKGKDSDGNTRRRTREEDEKETPVSYIQEKYPLSSEGRTDLYCVFIERGIQLLKKNGVLGFITPDKWYYEPYGKLLREGIIENHTLERVVIAGEKIFKSAFRKCPAVPAAITVIRKGEHEANHQTICEDYRTGYRLQFKDGEEETDYFNRFSLAPISKVGNTDQIENNFSCTFRVFSDVERSIIDRVGDNQRSISLGNIVYVNWGLRPKADKLIDNSERLPRNCFGLIKGEDFASGFFTGPANAVNYTQANIHPGRMGYPALMSSRRLLIAEVTGEEGIRAVIDPGENYNDHSVSMSILYSEIDYGEERLPSELEEVSDLVKQQSRAYNYDYIHGVLCARTTSFYHAKWLTNELNVYPEHVRNLRIPRIENSKHRTHIEALSRELQNFNTVDHDHKHAAMTCKKIVRALDRLIYEEFDLDQTMIDEIESLFPSELELPALTAAVKLARDSAA